MATATLTSKGQVTVPVEVRKRLHLKAGDRITFVFEPDGRVTLQTKRTPFEQVMGILRKPGQRPISVREMDRGIARAIQEDWRRIQRQKQ